MPEVWAPKNRIITARAIPENILAFVTNPARQTAALTWAGGSKLKLIKPLASSVIDRTKPIFPAIAFRDDNDAQEYTTDLIPTVYRVMFEFSIQNKDPDEAVRQARIYEKAFKSMIVNCPNATLLANTGAFEIILNTVETGFLAIKTNKKENDFLQQFQIRAAYSLRAQSVS